MKKTSKTILVLLLAVTLSMTALLLSSCGGNNKTTETKDASEDTGSAANVNPTEDTKTSSDADAASGEVTYPLTITDSLGNEITIESEPERIVSLSPANTEILFAIGAGDRVKGRTDYCSYPEEASKVESIGTYASPNTELIISMEPDVVFASDYVDETIKNQLEAAGTRVVVFSANRVEEIEAVIEMAGQILNLQANARKLTDQMEADLKEVQDSIKGKAGQKSIFVDIGDFYSAGPGSLLDDELNKLGVTNIAAGSGETWPQLSVETIIEKNPDLYLSLYTTPEDLKKVSGLNELDCIKKDRIIFFDGLSTEADIIQRPGPRITEGIRLLADKIYSK